MLRYDFGRAVLLGSGSSPDAETLLNGLELGSSGFRIGCLRTPTEDLIEAVAVLDDGVGEMCGLFLDVRFPPDPDRFAVVNGDLLLSKSGRILTRGTDLFRVFFESFFRRFLDPNHGVSLVPGVEDNRHSIAVTLNELRVGDEGPSRARYFDLEAPFPVAVHPPDDHEFFGKLPPLPLGEFRKWFRAVRALGPGVGDRQLSAGTVRTAA